MAKPREIGLYLHIPFCRKKCAYCDFPSYAGCEDKMPAVVRAMQDELRLWAKRLPDVHVRTLYVGGGTPSLLPPPLFAALLAAAHEAFSFTEDAECSCEMNPGTVTDAFLDAAVQGGIGRVSLGAQSADERLLRLLGRIHTFEDVRRAAALCRAHGIDNISLDLMLGLPTQTVHDVEETLRAFLSLQPAHMSCYGLIVEDGTLMKRQVDGGIWTLPDEDEERAMYELCRSTLKKHGLLQYEISNFALPSHECRHNVDCWKRREYIGIGCSACGFLGDVRYRNPASIDGYLRGDRPEETHVMPEDARFESVMLGLRMTAGIRDNGFAAMHGLTLRQAFGGKLDKPIRDGLLTFEGGVLRLTERGMDVQNAVLVELL